MSEQPATDARAGLLTLYDAAVRVDDVAAAVERVRRAGGTASEPERKPYGVSAECTDDQGSRFYLGET